jgi:AraC family transcriptional regulator
MRRVLNLQEDELSVLTDVPSEINVLPGGFLDFETSCNVVVHRISRRLVLPSAQTRLSLRAVYGGTRLFETTSGRFSIDDDRYLVLNQGEHTESRMDLPGPGTCLNITFDPEYASTLMRALLTPVDLLIACPDTRSSIQPFELLPGPHRHRGRISAILSSMRDACIAEQATAGWLEEQLHDLLLNMVSVNRGILAGIESVQAVKLSTRIELYQRLQIARDYIEDRYHHRITLEDIAREACLSTFHLLRLFKQVFGVSPHQYLTRIRLTRAKYLLVNTELSVSDICIQIGFESLGSFSWLFRKLFGMPPTAFRALRDRKGEVSSEYGR